MLSISSILKLTLVFLPVNDIDEIEIAFSIAAELGEQVHIAKPILERDGKNSDWSDQNPTRSSCVFVLCDNDKYLNYII